jgi:hypothetical protein
MVAALTTAGRARICHSVTFPLVPSRQCRQTRLRLVSTPVMPVLVLDPCERLRSTRRLRICLSLRNILPYLLQRSIALHSMTSQRSCLLQRFQSIRAHPPCVIPNPSVPSTRLVGCDKRLLYLQCGRQLRNRRDSGPRQHFS